MIGLVVRGLRDLRAPSYPVTAGSAADGRYPLDLRRVSRSFRVGADGVVAMDRGFRNPVSVSLYALGCVAPDRFLAQAGYLRASQDAEGGWRYPVPVRRYQVAPGWYSAMAQGLAISVLLRAHDATGQRSYLDAAGGALALLLRPAAAGGCADYDRAGRPFLEECPADPPGRILNGAVFALIGLAEYETRADPGPVYLAAGARLADELGGYDLGYWSRYDLRFTAPASLAYHCLHISLLEVAGRLLGDGRFGRTAARWRGYLRHPGYRLRAAANKARFVLDERRG